MNEIIIRVEEIAIKSAKALRQKDYATSKSYKDEFLNLKRSYSWMDLQTVWDNAFSRIYNNRV